MTGVTDDPTPAQTTPDQTAPAQNAPTPNPAKEPDDWATGDEPMTGPQQSYLSTLAQEAGVEVPEGLSKADASKMIDELQDKTGRGKATS